MSLQRFMKLKQIYNTMEKIKGQAKAEVNDYSNDTNFWIRLKSFVINVQVNDQMSEEEKEMILNICDKRIK